MECISLTSVYWKPNFNCNLLNSIAAKYTIRWKIHVGLRVQHRKRQMPLDILKKKQLRTNISKNLCIIVYCKSSKAAVLWLLVSCHFWGQGGGGGKNENGWNLKIDFDKRKWLNRYWYMNFKEEMQITRDIAKESYRLL